VHRVLFSAARPTGLAEWRTSRSGWPSRTSCGRT
jgi:hypothetical protein